VRGALDEARVTRAGNSRATMLPCAVLVVQADFVDGHPACRCGHNVQDNAGRKERAADELGAGREFRHVLLAGGIANDDADSSAYARVRIGHDLVRAIARLERGGLLTQVCSRQGPRPSCLDMSA
jgi:hypothetical protein